jgi:hypothetical protein
VELNRSSDQLEVIVRNTGEAIGNKTNISVGVVGGSIGETEQHNLDLEESELGTVSVPVDRTYPLETLQVSMTDYPVSTESRIKCTPTRQLKGYWSFNRDQTEGTTSTDLVGENNGELVNGIETVGGKVGEAYSFSGDDYVNISASEDLNFTGSFTWVSWTRPDNDTSGDNFMMWMSQGGTPYAGFHNGSFDVWASMTGKDLYTTSDKEYQVGDWNHYSFKYNKDNKSASILVNGNREAIDNETSGRMNYLDSTTLRIGKYVTYSYWGLIDEVRVYNRSLSQEEIQRLYQVRSENWAVDSCKLTG